MAKPWASWALSLVAATLAASHAMAAPAKSRAATPPDVLRLKPGEFVWTPGLAPKGPMVMFVSLKDQQAFIYRSGVRIGATRVSTGRRGYDTPVGVFEVVQKQVMHRSNLYDDAPMPFMQRLTWDGLALHAGNVPARPASHGCVRLPRALAKALYGQATMGMTVIIAEQALAPARLETKEFLAPPGPLRLPAADMAGGGSDMRIAAGTLAGLRLTRNASRDPENLPMAAGSAADLGVEAIATAPGAR